MADEYTWQVTLDDDSVYSEADGDSWDLDWETEGAVKKFELIGEKEFSVDLEKGEFVVAGKKEKPRGVTGDHTDKTLFFRKRRQVRTDGEEILDPRNNFVLGFVWKDDLYEAGVEPKIGMREEKVHKPKKSKKPKHIKIKKKP